jgi:hypothetical protein
MTKARFKKKLAGEIAEKEFLWSGNSGEKIQLYKFVQHRPFPLLGKSGRRDGAFGSTILLTYTPCFIPILWLVPASVTAVYNLCPSNCCMAYPDCDAETAYPGLSWQWRD